MRERLAQLLRSKSCWNNDCPEGGCEKCDYIGINDETAEQIADYLIANGVVVPPCKVGDRVYMVVNDKRVKNLMNVMLLAFGTLSTRIVARYILQDM